MNEDEKRCGPQPLPAEIWEEGQVCYPKAGQYLLKPGVHLGELNLCSKDQLLQIKFYCNIATPIQMISPTELSS